MPVPLSVTNPKAVGLAAAQAAELPTQGPFARMAAAAAVVEQPGNGTGAGAAGTAVVQPGPSGTAAANGSSDAGVPAVATNNLTFCYPDLGALLNPADHPYHP